MATLTSRSVVEAVKVKKTINRKETIKMITEKLIVEVMRYLMSVAMLRGLGYADACDAVSVSMLKAIETFKPEGGANFKTWAVTMLNQVGWKEVNRLRCPVTKTVGRGNGGEVEAFSLDAPIDNDRTNADRFEAEGNTGFEATLLQEDSEPVMDFANDNGDEDGDEDSKAIVLDAINQLPEKQAYAIRANLLEGKTCEQIGRELGVTKQAVNLNIQKGLATLRKAMAQG